MDCLRRSNFEGSQSRRSWFVVVEVVVVVVVDVVDPVVDVVPVEAPVVVFDGWVVELVEFDPVVVVFDDIVG